MAPATASGPYCRISSSSSVSWRDSDTVGIGHVAQIGFQHGVGTEAIEKIEQALLRLRASGRGPLFGQFRSKRSAPKVWPRRHERAIADDFLLRDRRW